LIAAAFLFAVPAFAKSANDTTVAQGVNGFGSHKITDNNGGVRMVGVVTFHIGEITCTGFKSAPLSAEHSQKLLQRVAGQPIRNLAIFKGYSSRASASEEGTLDSGIGLMRSRGRLKVMVRKLKK
jgi:hypothetical protein